MPEQITFPTIDGFVIAGDWTTAPTVNGAALLIHMMPETRGSWAPVQQALSKKGIASLAIDLRGHGQSIKTVEGNTVDYHSFTDDDHQTSILDLNAALDWIRSRGIELTRIALAGASFGADLVLQQLTDEPSVRGAVLLSPGMYHGLNPLEDVQDANPVQHLLIISSEEDTQSFSDSQKIYTDAPVESKTFLPLKAVGHGTAMFKANPNIVEKVANGLVEMITG